MESEGRKKKFLGANNWIRTEMNTWSLIHCLYKDRLITQKEEMEQDDLPLVNSEKLVVEHLYLSKLHLLDVLKFHWILLIIIF
jgi:nuclear pore complex protein Nup107